MCWNWGHCIICGLDVSICINAGMDAWAGFKDDVLISLFCSLGCWVFAWFLALVLISAWWSFSYTGKKWKWVRETCHLKPADLTSGVFHSLIYFAKLSNYICQETFCIKFSSAWFFSYKCFVLFMIIIRFIDRDSMLTVKCNL